MYLDKAQNMTKMKTLFENTENVQISDNLLVSKTLLNCVSSPILNHLTCQ
jgi:hypothetical protein